jgi:L-alanine-DL-glutamate epimerase-like enolase superfamily enzyme
MERGWPLSTNFPFHGTGERAKGGFRVKVTEGTTHVINSTGRNLMFVRVHADAGVIGTGECTPAYATVAIGTEAAARSGPVRGSS